MELTKLKNFNPGFDTTSIETVDMHTGGEPLRIIVDGLPEIKGKTILEKRRFFRDNYDNIRTSLMFEPRGHADMYGAVITEAESDDADFGTFFIHNEGYSTMCGHAIIALTKFAIESGLVKKEGANPVIEIDAPPGRISARAFIVNGLVESVSFRNVPSFVLLQDEQVDVEGIGRVKFDIAYGGAFYAFVEAAPLGLHLDGSDYNRLIDYGRRIKNAVVENFNITHPFENDLSFLYGTIFLGAPYIPENWSRNVCIFAEGELDRSPTGSGVSARAALHHQKHELNINQKVTIESILGTCMDVEVVETLKYGPYNAVIPEVSGTAHYTGRNTFWLDKDDPLLNGFIFR